MSPTAAYRHAPRRRPLVGTQHARARGLDDRHRQRRSPRLPLRRRQRRLMARSMRTIEHPADYVDVAGSLLAQNFLVARRLQAARPRAEGGLLSAGLGTLQHQSTLTPPRRTRLERLATDRRRPERLRRSDARGARARRAGDRPVRSQPARRLRHRRRATVSVVGRGHTQAGRRRARRGDGAARRRRARRSTCAARPSSSRSSPARTTAARRPAPMRWSPPASAGW